jgi:hypothetical protein
MKQIALCFKFTRTPNLSFTITIFSHAASPIYGIYHAQSEAVSALRRHHNAKAIQDLWRQIKAKAKSSPLSTFDPTKVPRSTTLHFDYTGALPERCNSGTLYFMICCWGSYIHIDPLHNLKGPQTAESLTRAVRFFRKHGVVLDNVRKDNQTSPEICAAAVLLGLVSNLVASDQKESNRSERAIQTGKNHIIATRAGFHRDCPHTLLDKCLPQVELTLNVLHPFEYDPRISVYHGVYGSPFDFMTHPIATAGSKVLAWDHPDNRGSLTTAQQAYTWAQH